MVAHELIGETLKYTPAGGELGLIPGTQEESDIVVAIENQYRNFHNMNNVRTGEDHFASFVVNVQSSPPRKRKRKKRGRN